jgi:hypothetical protein
MWGTGIPWCCGHNFPLPQGQSGSPSGARQTQSSVVSHKSLTNRTRTPRTSRALTCRSCGRVWRFAWVMCHQCLQSAHNQHHDTKGGGGPKTEHQPSPSDRQTLRPPSSVGASQAATCIKQRATFKTVAATDLRTRGYRGVVPKP